MDPQLLKALQILHVVQVTIESLLLGCRLLLREMFAKLFTSFC